MLECELFFLQVYDEFSKMSTCRAACLPGRRIAVIARPSLSRVDFSGCFCGGAGLAVLTVRSAADRRGSLGALVCGVPNL